MRAVPRWPPSDIDVFPQNRSLPVTTRLECSWPGAPSAWFQFPLAPGAGEWCRQQGGVPVTHSAYAFMLLLLQPSACGMGVLAWGELLEVVEGVPPRGNLS